MSLGEETIPLAPFKNWGQLDLYKWGMRGKLPGTPAGLEVTPDHVKIAGETVALTDPDGCRKLEKAFNDWLIIECRNLELARATSKARVSAPAGLTAAAPLPQGIRFRVEKDKRGQVHVHCFRGAESVASIGLAIQGFNGLFNQGLMRKPRELDVGALHDWVELDGELCSFEHGNNDSEKLEAVLNAKYVPLGSASSGKDVLVFANAASPTGFDIQFPVTVGGVAENRRRTLNEAALDLLQEPVRCGVLQPGLIIKLSPPTFIFKSKTHDGGEAYLPKKTETTVRIVGDDGRERLVDLSQPVNYSKMSTVDLAAVFNHPVVNRHSKQSAGSAPDASSASLVSAPTPVKASSLVPEQLPARLPEPALARSAEKLSEPFSTPAVPPLPLLPKSRPGDQPAQVEPPPVPNTWIKQMLSQPPIRYDWLTCLLYGKLAEHFGNSRTGCFGSSPCWSIALDLVSAIEETDFKGVFLTQKGGFGFLSYGRMLRFHRGVVFVGTRVSVLEGIDVNLLAVAADDGGQLMFIVTEGYLSKFGVPADIITQELMRLNQAGAALLSVSEVLSCPRPVAVIWTVPADQSDPANPQAQQYVRPLESSISGAVTVGCL